MYRAERKSGTDSFFRSASVRGADMKYLLVIIITVIVLYAACRVAGRNNNGKD